MVKLIYILDHILLLRGGTFDENPSAAMHLIIADLLANAMGVLGKHMFQFPVIR